MAASFDYDLVVIGAGSGGVRAARIAAGYGAKVLIAEESRVGGTCVIRGCVPKKLMVYASRFSETFEDAAGFGWSVGETRFDWAKLIAAKDKEISRLEGAYGGNLDRAGVEVANSRAVLDGLHRIRLVAEDRVISARVILIATGGTPARVPGIIGGELAITSNEVFDLPEMPKRVIVVGAGYIALEFAGIFNGLGAETTVMHRSDQILRGFDRELAGHLRTQMETKGVVFADKDLPVAIAREGDALSVTTKTGRVIATDAVFMATGRRPLIDGLGLETVGITPKSNGAIPVDAHSFTGVEGIYAVGDVTNRVNLTPVAIREGHAFADTVFGGKPTTVNHAGIPTAVFCQPEIGTVGLTEEQAAELYPNVDVYKTDFRPMYHTLSGRPERTFMKILVDADTDRVLGIHLLGGDAGELIQVLGIAYGMGATKAQFDQTVAVHPTAAEELVTLRTPSVRLRRRAAAE